MIIGNLIIQMSADLATLKTDMSKATAEVSSAAKEINGILGTIGLGLSVAGFVSLVKNAADAADAAAKLGDRFGIATESVVAMEHAVKLAGGSTEGLTTILRTLAKNSYDAAQGNTQLWLAFQKLGISAQDFVKLPMEQQFTLLIDRLNGVTNATERSALAQQIMGRQVGQIAGLIAEGSEALRRAKEDTEAWGLALDRVDAAKIEIMNDQIKRADDAFHGLATQVALVLAPAVAALAKQFADNAAAARGYRNEVVEGSGYVVEAIGYVGNVLRGVEYAWDALKVVVATVTGAVLEMFSQIALAVANNPITNWAAKLPGAIGDAAREVKSNAQGIGDNLGSLAQGFYDTADKVQNELNELVAAGLPHDRIVKWFDDAKATMQQEAAKFAAARKSAGGEANTLVTPVDTYTAGFAKQLEAVIQFNKTDLQLAQEHYDQRQAVLDEAAQKGFITDDYWQGQSALNYASFEQQKSEINLAEWQKRRQYEQLGVQAQMGAWAAAAEFLQVFAGKSKGAALAVLAIQKGLAIAQVIQQTSVAYMTALADPFTWPYEARLANAEFIRAMGAVQIGLIAATGIAQAAGLGGGGAASGSPANPISTTPGAPALPVSAATAPPAASQTVINVNVTGVVTQDVVDEMMAKIRDAIDNRDAVIISPISRQAANLAAA